MQLYQAERSVRVGGEAREQGPSHCSRVSQGGDWRYFNLCLHVFVKVLKGRFTTKEQYHHEQLLNLAYKESKDEFEDPDDLNRCNCKALKSLHLFSRRIFVDKLFLGMKDWNFGLFVQEIFKQELEEKDDCIKKVMDELDEDLESCDAKSFESAVSSAFPDLNEGKLETIVHGTFDQNLNKIISRVEVKRKLLFLDLVGLCK